MDFNCRYINKLPLQPNHFAKTENLPLNVVRKRFCNINNVARAFDSGKTIIWMNVSNLIIFTPDYKITDHQLKDCDQISH